MLTLYQSAPLVVCYHSLQFSHFLSLPINLGRWEGLRLIPSCFLNVFPVKHNNLKNSFKPSCSLQHLTNSYIQIISTKGTTGKLVAFICYTKCSFLKYNVFSIWLLCKQKLNRTKMFPLMGLFCTLVCTYVWTYIYTGKKWRYCRYTRQRKKVISGRCLCLPRSFVAPRFLPSQSTGNAFQSQHCREFSLTAESTRLTTGQGCPSLTPSWTRTWGEMERLCLPWNHPTACEEGEVSLRDPFIAY